MSNVTARLRCVAVLGSVLLVWPRLVAAESPVPVVEFVDPASPEVAAVLQAGQAATGQVAAKLMAEVTTALAAGGPVAAIDVCHVKALPLTGEKLSNLPQVTAVKRTSLKLRNPRNAPDAAEQAALTEMERRIAGGGAGPDFLVQKLTRPGAAPEWRVYRTIRLQPACLTCHGPSEQQSPELREALRLRYPQDQATGYQAGEWRGFIHATLK